jgi:hypothetical protein
MSDPYRCAIAIAICLDKATFVAQSIAQQICVCHFAGSGSASGSVR